MQKMDKNYSGMTVNERLYVSGLMSDFDKAVAQGDIEAAKLILKKAKLEEDLIIPILVNLGLSNI